MKLRAARDLAISGLQLAARAFTAALSDEIKLFIAPIILGGGKKSTPDSMRLGLELFALRVVNAARRR
jgi:riboflavin biosynthesis pyrimidine reductase